MSAADRLKDPWAAALGLVGGGTAFALLPGLALALPVGLGVAAVVYGAKVAGGALVARTEAPTPTGALPVRGSPAEVWTGRAERAAATLDAQVRACPDPVLRARLVEVVEPAGATVDAVRRLAGQSATVQRAHSRIPYERLVAERDRLEPGDPARPAVEEQLASYDRLGAAHDRLLSRIEAAVRGLEGTGGRVTEIVALAGPADAGTDPATDGVAAIGADLDALRVGLAATEEITRRVLGGGAT